MDAFAFQVYRRYMKGAAVADLAREYGIPEDRLEQRIRAAALCLKRERKPLELASLPGRTAYAGGGRA